jgi:hypothetical protein
MKWAMAVLVLAPLMLLGGCGGVGLTPEMRQEIVSTVSDVAAKAGENAAEKLFTALSGQLVDQAKKAGLGEEALKRLEETFTKMSSDVAAKAGEIARSETAKIVDAKLPKPDDGGGGKANGVFASIVSLLLTGAQLYAGRRA